MTTEADQALAELAQETRDLADSYLEHGYVEMPDFLRVMASIVEGDCPVHGREVGQLPHFTDLRGNDPLTGKPPEGREVPFHFWLPEGRPGHREVCMCLIGQDHQQDPIVENTT